MATKLIFYNGALLLLGEPPLSSLSEDRNARYYLDKAWDNDGGLINYCLQQGQWYFATRSQQITYSTTIIPSYGYRYAFEIPDDFMGICAIWADPFFKSSLDDYHIEAGVIYTNIDTIYLQFVSNASTYGGNLARWPASMTRYGQSELALLVEPLITNSQSTNNKIIKAVEQRKSTAKNNDKRDKPKDVLPLGAWSKARLDVGVNGYGYGYNGCGGGAPY